MARLHRRLAARRRRRPPRPARAAATRSRSPASPVRVDADGCSSSRTACSSTRATTAARSAAGRCPQSVLLDRVRAHATTRRLAARRRRQLRPRRCWSTCRRRPPTRRRSSPPTGAGASPTHGVTPAVRLGLRANARQFGLLVCLNAFVGAMVGLERSVLPLVGEEDFGLASNGAILVLRRRLRHREGAREPRRRRARRPGRPQAAARPRLAARAAGAAPDRTRAELGLHRRRERPARRRTRGSPGR